MRWLRGGCCRRCASFTRMSGEDTRIQVTDPATEEVVCCLPGSSPSQVDSAVGAAQSAFDDGRWSELTGDQRTDALTKAWQLLDRHREEFVRSLVTEVG